MNDKAIYEWLRPALTGTEWEIVTCRVAFYKYTKEDKTLWGCLLEPLPPLDMNTAFSEAIPKLKAEGIDSFFSSWAGWTLETDTDSWANPDFYIAVSEYLEAKA